MTYTELVTRFYEGASLTKGELELLITFIETVMLSLEAIYQNGEGYLVISDLRRIVYDVERVYKSS